MDEGIRWPIRVITLFFPSCSAGFHHDKDALWTVKNAFDVAVEYKSDLAFDGGDLGGPA